MRDLEISQHIHKPLFRLMSRKSHILKHSSVSVESSESLFSLDNKSEGDLKMKKLASFSRDHKKNLDGLESHFRFWDFVSFQWLRSPCPVSLCCTHECSVLRHGKNEHELQGIKGLLGALYVGM